MADNTSKMRIVGNIGRDAKVRTVGGGQKVTTFSVAVNFDRTNGTDGVQWIDVNIWGNRGVKIAPYITEGKLMGFEGRPDARAFTDPNTGKARAVLVLNVNPSDEIMFLSDGARAAVTEPAEPDDENEIPF